MTQEYDAQEVVEFCGCGASVRFPYGSHAAGMLNAFRTNHRCLPVTVEEGDTSDGAAQGESPHPVDDARPAENSDSPSDPQPVAVTGTIVNTSSRKAIGFV